MRSPQIRRRIGFAEFLESRCLMASFENFDGVTFPLLPSGWQSTGTPAWNTVSGNSDSAPNHAFVANIPTVQDSILTSPSFLLSPTTPRMSFRHSFDTEAQWDGGVIEISINGGSFSDIVTRGGTFVTGGYTGVLNNSGNPLAGRNAWQGNSNGYITSTIAFPNAALNQNIALRWRLGSDESVNFTGWRLDTITLDELPTQDFGDAPSSYPVNLASNGARHTVGSLFLGASVDTEADGFSSEDASADGSDEDGVALPNSLSAGQTVSLAITASVSGGFLNAWIDWNGDGDWLDSREQISVDRLLNAGVNNLSIAVPAGARSGLTFARFRLSETTGLAPTGSVETGEVEDYRVFVSTPGVWTPLGPFSAVNGQVENIPNRPVSGAIHTVIAHPTDANILYVGAVNGGVWKTTNATATFPNWIPLTDSLPSLSIGALTFDVSDSSNGTILAGTGTYSSFGRIGNQRVGLYRSTNGGQNWQVLDGGGILRGKNISGIYANGNTIVVSVNTTNSGNSGVYRSTNGGTTFIQVSGGAGTGLPTGASYDLIYDPINTNTLYTSMVFSTTNGVYRSIDAGATWTKVSTPVMDSLMIANTSNLEMAAGRRNEVYAAIINSGAFAGLFRSPDNGNTWTQMDSPSTNENGTDVGLNPSGGKGPTSGKPDEIAGGQGAIHFAIVADPNDENLVYVGGDRQPRSNGDAGTFPNSIGANDFSGRLFRGDASRPAGSQFVHLTHRNNLGPLGGGTASSSSPHADSREMVFDAAGNIVEVDDGGVYRRSNPQSNTGDWFSLNGNIQVTEAHDAAWDPVSNVAITGNQDTGTTYQPSEGASQWVSISTADGGDVSIDRLALATSNQSVRYSSFQNLGSFRRTVWNTQGAIVSTNFPALTPINGSPRITGAFRTPVETNAVSGGRLLFQGSNGIFESLDQGATVNLIGASLGSNNITANAIAYGGQKNNVANAEVVWAARGSDVFYRATSGALSQVPSDPTSGTIRDLAIDGSDYEIGAVVTSNQVFRSMNAGASWSNITGNLLAQATEVFSIAHIVGALGGWLAAGTNAGIYVMAVSQLGNWTRLGSSLPNALSYDLQYEPQDDVLIVGTLGRGAWRLNNVSSLLASTAVSVVDSKVYYKGSVFDTSVDTALDPVKVLAKSGTTAQLLSFDNVVNNSRGINGLVFDVVGLASATLTAADFVFRMSPQGLFDEAANPPSGWAVAPAPTAINVTAATPSVPGRIRIEWADNAIADRWLQVSLLANANTGLTTRQVYYLGHLLGETNGVVEGGGFLVRTLDVAQIAASIGQSATVGSVLDVDKDGLVRTLDAAAAAGAIGRSLRLITIPIGGSSVEGNFGGFGTFSGSGSGKSDGGFAAPVVDLTTVCESFDHPVAATSNHELVIDDLFDVALPLGMVVEVASSIMGPNLLEVREDSREEESQSELSHDLLSLDAYFEEISKKRSRTRVR